ncbi:MAG: cell division protein FtsH, partial [Candidatus Omnitrophica bacterium]|nr:cell division protein FtsH [Candidatus Omnitrophota bacterium]
TGSENDLRIATEIARKMVCEWGMSEKLGPVSFREHEAVFLGRDLVQQRTLSEATNKEIDNEIRNILEKASQTAEQIIRNNMNKLKALVEKLLEKETLSSEEIRLVLGDNNGQKQIEQRNREGSQKDS